MPQIYPHPVALYVQLFGTALFCTVFLFIRRESGILYFGYWGVAWGLQTIALACSLLFFRGVAGPWLFGWAFFEFGFCMALLAAAQAEGRTHADLKARWRFFLGLPLFLALVYVMAVRTSFAGYHAMHALVLMVFYSYTFLAAPGMHGLGRRLFRAALAGLAVTSLHASAMFFHIHITGHVPDWAAYFRYHDLFDFGLQSVLAFAAMSMWIGHLTERLETAGEELERVRNDNLRSADVDHLTGLLNHAALSRLMNANEPVSGTVAVCDLDNFKEVNDRYGHLVGDEVLRNIGHLLRGSVREQDEAFRWGGDEFVILFRDATPAMITSRMVRIEDRLRHFQVRGYGSLPIGMSWGIAEVGGRALSTVLDEADQTMYRSKRSRRQVRAAGTGDARA